MTTSISSAEVSSLGDATATSGPGTEGSIPKSVEPPVYRVQHTLASRFIFLNLCVAIVLGALAFGTVHYWALVLFSLGALATLVLWVIDAWRLGKLRISRNPLQIPLLGMLALGLIQLLPFRDTPATGALTVRVSRALS
ncbi:MAG: hypothetical protein LC775_09130, partial [Acidobacteria bacterium]|nr:hypothetical protein [Acidobacteriota bacterium]